MLFEHFYATFCLWLQLIAAIPVFFFVASILFIVELFKAPYVLYAAMQFVHSGLSVYFSWVLLRKCIDLPMF